MSWSKFLTNSPPIVKNTDFSQLKSSMKKKSLRLDQSTVNCLFKCNTEEEQKRVSFKENQNSCLSDLNSIPRSFRSKANYTFKQATLLEINQTLKEIKSLTLQNNSNMKKVLNIVEERSLEKGAKKSKRKDNKSTVKKSKSKNVIVDKHCPKFKQFDKLKKQMETHLKRISTTVRLPKK